MKYQSLVLFLTLLVIIPLSVHADYNFYQEYGNNPGHSHYVKTTNSQDVFTQVSLPNGNNGSFTEPVVQDINGDGITELFMQGANGVIYVLDGEDPTNVQTTLGIGRIDINPVICDVNNDGRLDYVVIVRNATTPNNAIYAIDINDEGNPELVAQGIVNKTSVHGNIACGQFYQAEGTGDDDNYIMFLDETKRLYILKAVSGGFEGDNILVAPPVIEGVLDATTEESIYTIGTGTNISHRNSQLAYSTSFDPSGTNTILFQAGRNAYVYQSDGVAHGINVNSSLSTSYNPGVTGGVKVYGDIRTSSTGSTRAAFLYDGSRGATTAICAAQLVILQMNSGFSFSGRLSITQTDTTNILPTSCTSGNTPQYSSLAVVPTSSGGFNNGRDMLYLKTEKVSATASIESPVLRIIFSQNLSQYKGQTFGTSVAASMVGSGSFPNGQSKVMVADFNKDGDPDYLFTLGSSAEVCIAYAPYNASSVGTFTSTFGRVDCFANLSLPGNQEFSAPIIYDSGGKINLAYSTDLLSAYFTNLESNAGNNLPFHVTLNNTVGLSSIQEVTLDFDNEQNSINYALTCDVSSAPVWVETFNQFYNFTTNNVSTSFSNPQNYLSFVGLTYNMTSDTQPNFDIVKNANQALRRDLTLVVQYTTSNNTITDVLAYDESNDLTLWLQLNKTGNSLEVNNINPFFIFQNIGNATLQNGVVDLQIVLMPGVNEQTNQEYFDFTIIVGNVTIGTGDTATLSGTTIQNVELFSGSRNTTTVYKKLALYEVSNPQPGFVQFQNHFRTTDQGVTIDVPASSDSFQGDGYTVYPGVNETFYSQCDYSTNGTYTQRHYIAPINTVDDYSNHRDLTVTVREGTDTTGEGGASGDGAASDGSGDFANDVLPGFLQALGLHSAASQLFFWVLLSLAISIIIFTINPIGGLLTFAVLIIVGVAVSVVSLWVVLIFVVLCAGLFALGVRYLFGGS